MFERALEQARVKYGFFILGYVVMPEHIHLLVSEPQRDTLATAIKAIKQSVARRQVKPGEHFWQQRYYDFNVGTPEKRVEKLKYIHRNPVHRELVTTPQDWPWSSYRHYASGEVRTVQIESPVAAWKRRQVGNQNALVLPKNEHPAQASLERGTRPLMVHRALYGSVERFFGVLIEHYAGAFPVWLSPVQVVIIPIGEKHHAYAHEVGEKLKAAGVRVHVDARNEKMNAKIREHALQKVPFQLVVGDKEVESGQVNVRVRGQEKAEGSVAVEAFVERVKGLIETKAAGL